MPLPTLILASGSPQRRNLLTEAGFKFEVVAPDESAECGICSSSGPAALVAELAQRKAVDVAKQLACQETDARLLIACDTVAECRGTILGKPADEDHARHMLEQLSGTTHRVYSGLCLFPFNTDQLGTPEIQIATTVLQMDKLSDDQLDDYLDSGLWQGKAGACGFQDRIGWLHIVKGSETNVIGLPMELLTNMLSARGYYSDSK